MHKTVKYTLLWPLQSFFYYLYRGFKINAYENQTS